MLKHLLPNNVKISITIDDIRIKSNLIKNQALILTKRFFSNTKLVFVQAHSGPLGDIEGSIQLIPG